MTDNEKIKELISQMTLEEKVSQLTYTSPAIERLGIPEYNWWNECLHGVARNGVATVFPQAIALAATFDTDMAYQVADAISDEARAKYNLTSSKNNRGQYCGLTFWTPNINIFRDPRWGRGQETYGEDPYLTGEMGKAFVRGLQGPDPEHYLKTAACAKHFAVHSGPEKLRHTFNAVCSQKDLWETYLPAFKELADCGVESFMGAYNRTLGEPCCGSKYLLKDILRGKWKFTGHIVSDCWAIRDFHETHNVTDTPSDSAALALNNGCDLNCGCTYPALVSACKLGLVKEETINASVERLLRTRFKLGMFDFDEPDPKKRNPSGNSKYNKIGKEQIHSAQHIELAKKEAEESIVLLKNKNNLLPLKDNAGKVLVMGPGAADVDALLANYYGLSPHFVTILEGLTEKTADKYEINLQYHQACDMYNYNKQNGWVVGMAEGSDVVIAVFGLDNAMEGEEGAVIASDSKGDRETIELPAWQLDYLREVKERGKPVVLVLTGGSAIAFPEDIADAILFVWYSGEQGGKAVANVIFGDTIPSGKLPVTFPAATNQLPDFDNYSMKGRTYRYMEKEPLYPFGFGLSYTTFNFDNVELISNNTTLPTEITKETLQNTITARVSLTNTGNYTADEVVQVYVSKKDRDLNSPITSLKGFGRISIEKGTKTTIDINLSKEAFCTITENGESEIQSGTYLVTVADAAPVPVSIKKGASKPITIEVIIK